MLSKDKMFFGFLLIIFITLHSSYKYQLSVTAMFQNEASILKEWIEFHKLVGVEHFYLYNNMSTDGYKKILAPYIVKKEVTLIEWPYKMDNWMPIQMNANRDGIKKFGKETKWLAIIDLDEFLVPVKEDSIMKILARFEDVGGVGVNWVMFGTSNVFKIPYNKLFVESLHLRSEDNFYENRHIKSIVRPDRIHKIDSLHFPRYKPGYYNVSTNNTKINGAFSAVPVLDELRINHYWCRNEDYFLNYKLKRRAKLGDNPNVWIAHAQKNYSNVHDDSMDKFIPQLRQKLGFKK